MDRTTLIWPWSEPALRVIPDSEIEFVTLSQHSSDFMKENEKADFIPGPKPSREYESINVVNAGYIMTPMSSPVCALFVVGEVMEGGWTDPIIVPHKSHGDSPEGTYCFSLYARRPKPDSAPPILSSLYATLPLLWVPKGFRAVFYPGEIVATKLERRNQQAGIKVEGNFQLRHGIQQQLSNSIGHHMKQNRPPRKEM